MESWSCVSGGMYGSASTGTISSSSSFPRNADVLKNWELRAPYRVGENVIFTWNQQSVESRCLVELDYGELVGKHLATDSIREGFRSKYNGERVSSPILGTPVAYSGEDESPSKLSSSVVDSNSRDSSLIDLKLGRFVDNQDVASYFPKGTPILSSADSSKPPKKLRVGVSNFRTAYCQVYGCNKDLSSSKDYHKRHKVCEAHSKTAKVIVNGIEQRFCQQCSRFHLLAEFDDGKRSCRKRLAGHNERRRKPQVGIPSVRTGKILPAYAGLMGSRFQGMPTPTSFICHDILPNDPFHPEKYVASDWCRRIKTEDVTNISILSAIPSTAEHPHSKSAVPSSDYEKLFPSFNEQGPNAAAEYGFGEQSNRYPSYYGGTASGSRSLIQEGSLGSEEFNILNASPAIHELPGIADSGCALSLLSSQSQNSASQSSGILLALPLASSGTENHCNLGVRTQASSGRMSNRFSSLRLNPTAGGHLSPMMISNGSEAAEFNITDGIYQSSELFTPKDQLSCGDGQTIDLLQLSSQLQRVEQQRQSMSIKQENDAFCCL